VKVRLRNLVTVLTICLVSFCLIVQIHAQSSSTRILLASGIMVYNTYMLSVSGTIIVDGSGNRVVLVGTQMDFNGRKDGWFSIEDVQKMKSLGGTVLEIHGVRFKEMMPERGVINEGWFINNLDKWVSWCEQLQIYYIINLRNFKWASWGGCMMPEWFFEGKYDPPYDEATCDKACIDFWNIDNPLQEDNRQNFIDLWKFIANRYKNNEYALLGIINEPLCQVKLNSDLAKHLGLTYSRFIERVVDAIRSTGAKQLIFVDRPYIWGLSNVHPIDRPNIVWEDHLYVQTNYEPKDINSWKTFMDNKIQRFVKDFGKSLYVGEYGAYPFSAYHDGLRDWPNLLAEQVAYLKSSEIAGYSWHAWPFLEGEYYDHIYDYLTKEKSDYILQTIYG